MNAHLDPRPDRRTAIKWMLTAAASAAILPRRGLQAQTTTGSATPSAFGYGFDPDLLKDYKPGDLWPLSLSDTHRRAAAALCAIIIPADEKSPDAASLGVHDFIDEWISAPYEQQLADRPVILEGLEWIDAEAQKRFQRVFADLFADQQRSICEDIHYAPEALPEFQKAADFFARFRDLTAGGFYTTPEGMADIGYVGNRPTLDFDGPPRELLEKLGLVDA